MSKIPQRITSFKEYQMTVLSVTDHFHQYTSYDEIIDQFQKYIDIMKPYYYDVCECAFLARTAYSFKRIMNSTRTA